MCGRLLWNIVLGSRGFHSGEWETRSSVNTQLLLIVGFRVSQTWTELSSWPLLALWTAYMSTPVISWWSGTFLVFTLSSPSAPYNCGHDHRRIFPWFYPRMQSSFLVELLSISTSPLPVGQQHSDAQKCFVFEVLSSTCMLPRNRN